MDANDELKTTGQKAEDDLRLKRRVTDTVYGITRGAKTSAEIEKANLLGQNVMREEIGFFGPWDGVNYTIDEKTMNRLIVHSRQDIATNYALLVLVASGVENTHRVVTQIRNIALFSSASIIIALIYIIYKI